MRLFDKILNGIDMQKLIITGDSLAELQRTLPDEFGYSIELPVKDERGKEYKFRFTVDSQSNTPRGFFSSGWVDFVRDNSLKARDEVIFRKEQGDNFYKIKAKISDNNRGDSSKKNRGDFSKKNRGDSSKKARE